MQDTRQNAAEPTLHRFDNGLVVENGCLIDAQRQRYAVTNLHEPVEEDWICRLCHASAASPFTFWDIGAGIGYYAMLVATRRPDAIVYAFEPLPAHAAAIRRHWARNRLDPARLVLHEAAVGAAPGIAHLVDRNFSSHLARGAAPAAALPVPVVTVDAMLHARPGPVDLIKVDIQGLEDDLLSGASDAAGRVCAWVIGTHGAAVHRRVHDRLVALGYVIVLSEVEVPGQPDGLVIATAPAG